MNPQLPARIIGATFGIVFCCIGLTVIGGVWLASGFGAPPLIFKLVATLISLVFVVMGGATAIAAITGKPLNGPLPSRFRARNNISGQSTKTSYECPNCGSGLPDGSDVSPSGDIKCSYCDRWFNTHQTN